MRILATAILLGLSACATPMPPSGGPADQSPPEIIETLPPRDAVNVTTDRLVMTFSEHVDAGSFAGAFSMTPAFDQPLDFNWSGRRVEIIFPESLRENTTYLVTIDRGFRDARGVQLQSPMTFAFSTGPTINRGTISGTVVLPAAGRPASGIDVFAYANPVRDAPADQLDRPDYRTQTDDAGIFRFDYLNEQPYFVIALRDANRNFAPDPNEEFAVPHTLAIGADTLSDSNTHPWVLTGLDTIPPEPLRIRSMTRGLHAVRFSEPVSFEDRNPDSWSLQDSLTGAEQSINDLFIDGSEPTQIFILTEPLGSDAYTLVPGAVVDTSGNRVRQLPVSFVPAQHEDTLRHRFLGFSPRENDDGIRILPDAAGPGLRLTRPASPNWIEEVVSVTDTLGSTISFTTESVDGLLHQIRPDPPLERGRRIRVAVSGEAFGVADTTFTAEFERLSADLTGEIAGRFTTSGGQPRVEVSPVETEIDFPMVSAVADATGHFIVSGLPEGTYQLRAYSDVNGNERWDGGRIVPYRSAEPIIWVQEPVRVRPRWETTLPDTLHIPPLE